MKYSCHVYNNFIWFWYDLHGTNPCWRCFQQNYRGVVFCAEMKVLQMSWNFLMIFLEQKRPPKLCGRSRRATRRAQPTRACPGALVSCGGCGPPFALILSPRNHIYSKIILHKFLSHLDFVWYGFSTKQKHATNRNWHWALDQYVSPKNNIKVAKSIWKLYNIGMEQ